MKTQIIFISLFLSLSLMGKLSFADMESVESIVPVVTVSLPSFELLEESEEMFIENWMNDDDFWQMENDELQTVTKKTSNDVSDRLVSEWIEEGEELKIEPWMVDEKFWE